MNETFFTDDEIHNFFAEENLKEWDSTYEFMIRLGLDPAEARAIAYGAI